LVAGAVAKLSEERVQRHVNQRGKPHVGAVKPKHAGEWVGHHDAGETGGFRRGKSDR
jgi:hypothetical protein